MKQTTPIRWIEAAEARAVCLLAVTEPGSVRFAASPEAVHAAPAGARSPAVLRWLGRLLGAADNIRSAA